MANNWTEIRAKCMDGEIEPHHCEYYGEPNGCNSPIYGEHPSMPNAAAMHSCLLKILAEMIDLGGIEVGRKVRFSPGAITDEIRQALAAPPRNCDKYPTFNDAIRALADKRGWHDAKWDSERYCILASWLYAPYEEG